mmetsp:Transcript_35540/g.43514  ORF Transcript_35540/g.43514 Transcript_35540/m.43514 type:complete len:513 (-) Transcript_35540:138-1676(-)|eukprot:CAMPEP_0172508172 /NCGR_PEP_ID=MMETSP1066-20121228/209950_1 /TAXON_ID=671091 /ORGANISM="Coscinodiscus wailesii, Strain CCMP2513" /LENGTH=512 /DNA_ID=CAMNT_0013286041 /DNA_START=84 /DNA_END=1622 /DNA_ORIENTATION=+
MSETSWIFDYIAATLNSSRWDAEVMSFVDEYCIIFDNDDENKFIYTELHTEFKYLIEEVLTTLLAEVGIGEDEFYRACVLDRFSHDINKKVFDQIMAVDDFLVFKEMMIRRNIELEMEALRAMKSGDTADFFPESYNAAIVVVDNDKDEDIFPKECLDVVEKDVNEKVSQEKCLNEELNEPKKCDNDVVCRYGKESDEKDDERENINMPKSKPDRDCFDFPVNTQHVHDINVNEKLFLVQTLEQKDAKKSPAATISAIATSSINDDCKCGDSTKVHSLENKDVMKTSSAGTTTTTTTTPSLVVDDQKCEGANPCKHVKDVQHDKYANMTELYIAGVGNVDIDNGCCRSGCEKRQDVIDSKIEEFFSPASMEEKKQQQTTKNSDALYVTQKNERNSSMSLKKKNAIPQYSDPKRESLKCNHKMLLERRLRLEHNRHLSRLTTEEKRVRHEHLRQQRDLIAVKKRVQRETVFERNNDTTINSQVAKLEKVGIDNKMSNIGSILAAQLRQSASKY